MNIPFDIVKGKGPIIANPISEASQVNEVREFVPEENVPYVGEALTILRKEVLDVVHFFSVYSSLAFQLFVNLSCIFLSRLTTKQQFLVSLGLLSPLHHTWSKVVRRSTFQK